MFAQRSLGSPVGVCPNTSPLSVGSPVLTVIDRLVRNVCHDGPLAQRSRVWIFEEEGDVEFGGDVEYSLDHGVGRVEVTRAAPGACTAVHGAHG